MKKRDVERTQIVQIQKDLSDAPAILVTMETDTTAQVCQCFIPFSRQGPYKVSHSPDQTIVEEAQCLDYYNYFPTNFDKPPYQVSSITQIMLKCEGRF